MAAPLDPDHMPIPILMVSPAGGVTSNHAFEQLLGRHESTRDLVARFEVLPGLPWERVLREDFAEEEVWFDRVTSSRLRYFVHGRAIDRGGILVLDDLEHSIRLVDFVEAAARSALADTLPQVGAVLARAIAEVTGADAVIIYTASHAPDALATLAAWPNGLAPGPIAAAVEAATARIHCVVPAIDSPDVTCVETKRLLDAGVHSLVAFPLAVAASNVGALVLAWRQPCTLQLSEKKLVDAVSHACAAALVHTRAWQAERAEAAVLHKLRAAALAIRELGPVRHVLEQLVDQACELAGARRGAAGLIAHGGEQLADVIVIGTGDDSARIRALAEDLATSTTCRRDGHYVGVPLRVSDYAIGSVVVCDKRDGSRFTEQDEHLLELFGSQAALAIGYSQQLQRAEEAQGRLANLHDELAAVIAHDMRTPIAAILLRIEALLERAKREDHVTIPTVALARMHHAGQRISRLAGDLLDVSRIELGRVALDRRQLSLRDAISDLVAQLEPAFGQRPIKIVEQGEVPHVSADPMRFDQIVTNLLENAAKYSKPGRPIIVRISGDGPGATVSIEDEGPGIPPADVPKLFDRFFQTRAARARKSGLGLGLYIAKGLVEAHGGRIWVDSLDRGNQFHVWLPCTHDGHHP